MYQRSGFLGKRSVVKKLGTLLIICSALVGCSSKFVYNNMDWLLIEYLEDYVELNDAQEEVVEQKIALLSEWHRSEEIPNYIDHLDELMQINPNTLTLEQLEEQQAKFQQHSERLVARIAPELYEVAQELSDEQVEELMDNIRVRHTKYKNKYQPLTETETRHVYQERIEDNLDTWLGEVNAPQKRLVEQWTQEMYVTSGDWVNYQTNMRIEVNTLLNDRHDLIRFKPEFDNLMFNPRSLYTNQLENKLNHNRNVANNYLIKIINSMTEEQTEHYRAELQDWKELAVAVQ